MKYMMVESSRDVTLEVLSDFKKELGDDFPVEIGGQVILLSATPPSFINLIADPSWWLNILGAIAGGFVADLAKDAAKNTWKNRGKAIAMLRQSNDNLKKLAVAITRLLSRLKQNTHIFIGIPVTGETDSTQLFLSSGDENDLTIEIAMFVYYLPALTKLLKTEGLGSGKTCGVIRLNFLEDGSLEVRWVERRSNIQIRRVIPLDYSP